MEKEVKLSRFSRDTLYIRDPEHPTRKLENNQWFQWEGTKSIHPQETHWERDRGHAPIYSSIKDNTIPWNKPNPGGERQKLWTFGRRDWERHWKMERHPNFMNWQHLYCENDHPTKSILQIQCNQNQNTHNILHRTRKKNQNYGMRKTSDSQPMQSWTKRMVLNELPPQTSRFIIELH